MENIILTLEEYTSQLSDGNIKTIACIAIGCFALFILTTVIGEVARHKKASKYISLLTAAFGETGNLRDTFRRVSEEYPKKSYEAMQLRCAADHMEFSARKDPETAFVYAEGTFHGKKVKAVHRQILADLAEKEVTPDAYIRDCGGQTDTPVDVCGACDAKDVGCASCDGKGEGA